jgi:hypothetical protein
MRNETTSLNGRVRAIRTRSLDRARVIWSELDYAQRRMFEIQTGLTTRDDELSQLERHYTYKPRRA